MLEQRAKALKLKLDVRQSNHEGVMVDWLHEAMAKASAVIINAGAYAHSSIAIRDAVAALPIPVIEVHLTNIYAREGFRRHSLLGQVARGSIVGFGPWAMSSHWTRRRTSARERPRRRRRAKFNRGCEPWPRRPRARKTAICASIPRWCVSSPSSSTENALTEIEVADGERRIKVCREPAAVCERRSSRAGGGPER